MKLAEACKIDFYAVEEDTLEASIEDTDLLFIDTKHTYHQLSQELYLHSEKVKTYIIIHDTETYGRKDEGKKERAGKHGLMTAIEDFLGNNPEWKIKEHFENNNGLTVLKRVWE
jgi:hypothetical protein